MNFSEALTELKKGDKLRMRSWPSESFIFLVNGSEFEVNRLPLQGIFKDGTKIKYHPHIDIHTHGKEVEVWTPTTAAILATDWDIVC